LLRLTILLQLLYLVRTYVKPVLMVGTSSKLLQLHLCMERVSDVMKLVRHVTDRFILSVYLVTMSGSSWAQLAIVRTA